MAKRRSMIRLTGVVLAGVSVVTGACSISPTSSEERSARADVVAVSGAVAEHIGTEGRLPRVRVTEDRFSGGDIGWGADFLVESRSVPRADPSRARLFFVVGDSERWCVEMLYNPPATFSDSSPAAWVAARGEGEVAGPVADGRCGENYLLFLSPVTSTNVPEPGSTVDAASAPVGTCVSDVLHDGSSTGPLEVLDCGIGHFAEIYHADQIDVGDYGEFQEAAAEACAHAFPQFVGIPQNLSALTGEPFTVSEGQWQTDERQFSCVLFVGSEDYPLVGSARDSWR